MLYAYARSGSGLAPMPPEDDLASALWIDLYRPLDGQIRAVAALGYEVPTLADMEEIEISNRLYQEAGTLYMTGVLPGQLPDGDAVAMPVTFILNHRQLVTVRHHVPRPFETFPTRADRSSSGCASPERIFLGLVEEIVGRLADISENVSKVLDATSERVLHKVAKGNADYLQNALVTTGQQAEMMGRVRLGLLSMDRILVYHASSALASASLTVEGPDHKDAKDGKETKDGGQSKATRVLRAALQRDIQSLEVHADFLTSRIGMTIDATMGMIGLQQNERVRILSVMTALFMPPTLIASIYGMNFHLFPGLEWTFGLPMALGMMLISVIAVVALLKLKDWL